MRLPEGWNKVRQEGWKAITGKTVRWAVDMGLWSA